MLATLRLGAALGLTVVGVVSGCSSPPSPPPTPSNSAICQTLAGDDFFIEPQGTYRPGTEPSHVPRQVALNVLTLLKHAHASGLRDEVTPLERAIRSKNQAAMDSISGNIESNLCERYYGLVPST